MSRIIEDTQNLIRHSGSPLNLKEGLRKLLDEYITLADQLDSAQRRIEDLEEGEIWRDIE